MSSVAIEIANVQVNSCYYYIVVRCSKHPLKVIYKYTVITLLGDNKLFICKAFFLYLDSPRPYFLIHLM
jgi:hypothetical protein